MNDIHTGGCHCKKVRYEVKNLPFDHVIECNCSHCSMQGALLSFVPENDFKLLEGEGDLTSYKFNKHVIDHLFCKHCGVESFAKGSGPNGPMVAINMRCVDGIDLTTLKRTPYNGRDQ